MANAPNWNAIRAEYIAGATQRQLAAKYSVSRNSISAKARQEGWTEKREECKAETVQKVVQTVADDRAELARRASKLGSRVLELSERIIDRLEQDDVSRASADGLEADLAKTIQAYTMMAKSLGIDAESIANRNRLELERERLKLEKEQAAQSTGEEMPTIIIRRE